MEAAGQEVDHGGLTIATPSEVAYADDGHGQCAALAEPGEEQGQAEYGGRGGEEREGEGAVEEGEVPHGGVRGGGETRDELPRRLLHTPSPFRGGATAGMGDGLFGLRRRREGQGAAETMVGWHPDGPFFFAEFALGPCQTLIGEKTFLSTYHFIPDLSAGNLTQLSKQLNYLPA